MQLDVVPEKCLTKILQFLLTFFDISQPFKCLSILSPSVTINFLLFELMSRLLIDELSSLLSTLLLVDALSPFLLNVDCFGSIWAISWFYYIEVFEKILLSCNLLLIQFQEILYWRSYYMVLNHFSLIVDSTKNQ